MCFFKKTKNLFKTNILADIHLFSIEESKYANRCCVFSNWKIKIQFNDVKIASTVIFQLGTDVILPGNDAIVNIILESPAPLDISIENKFNIFNMYGAPTNQIIGTGVVKKIYNDNDIDNFNSNF